jgi:hypothetical protein
VALSSRTLSECVRLARWSDFVDRRGQVTSG